MIFNILLLLISVSESLQIVQKCLDTNDKCNSVKNYESYKNCERRRLKRSVDCDTDCSECHCESCNYSNCNGQCDSCCNSCCSNFMPCVTDDCCRYTCKHQCRSSDCKRKCSRNCNENTKFNYEKNISVISKNDNNVTTIINLNNVINNKNDIDVPIQINTTLMQNITLPNNQFQGNGSTQNNCCIIISPRHCIPTDEPPFTRCFHYRTRQCGDFCTANIVHKEKRDICEPAYPGGPTNCHPKIIYIPQPQPKCRYEPSWPYVSCGIQKSTSCAGCYANEHTKSYMTCPPDCYDVGFGTYPYYRPGPFYRRTYLGENGFGIYDYGGLERYPPYGRQGGAFFPPIHDESRFEYMSPNGFGPVNEGFEPVMSASQENERDRLNVGPNFPNGLDTFRNIRDTIVDRNQIKPNITVHVELKKNQSDASIKNH